VQDPFGLVLVTIRDDDVVAALVGDRVSANAEQPPSVRLRAMPTSRYPFGPGSGHLGLQRVEYVAQCYAEPTPTGEMEARALAGAVSDAIHNRRDITNGTGFILKAYAPDISEILRDPDTRWVYHQVRIEAIAAAQAVT